MISRIRSSLSVCDGEKLGGHWNKAITGFLSGIAVNTPDGVLQARAALLLCSMDLPARAYVINMKKYNGRCSCLFCYHPGVTAPTNHLHRFWPERTSTSRTHISILQDARTALATGKPVS